MKPCKSSSLAAKYHLSVLLATLTFAPLAAIGAPPTIEIKSPSSQVTVSEGYAVPLRGHAIDAATGHVIPPRYLVWTSNLDGKLGNGPGIDVKLSAGTHTVNLSATNENGEVALATVAVTVKKP